MAGHNFAGDQVVAVLLVTRERLLDDGDGGVGGADFLDLDLLAFELLIVLKKAFKDEQAMTGKIAGFEIFAEFGVVGGDGDDFVIGGAAVDHGHNADSASFDEGEGLNRFLAKNENVQRVIVFGIGLRDEAVVCGIEDGGMDDAIDFEQAGRLIEFVFEIGTERNFDNGLEIAGDIFAGRNVVPRVDQEFSSPMRLMSLSLAWRLGQNWKIRGGGEVIASRL